MIAALHAEWVKATTLRSTWLCLAGFAVAAAGISAAVVGAIGDLEATQPGYDAGLLTFYGLNFGQVALVVLAVLLTAGEHGRQTLHTSLVAVPRRGVFLASKVAVGSALVLVTATVTAVVSAVVTQRLLGPAGVALSELARPTVAAALQPTLLAVVCMGAAMMMRDQAIALGLLIPFFFLVSPLLELVPVLQRLAVYLPDRAGQVAIRLHARPIDVFGPVAGLAVLALWAAAAVLGAWWVLRRRDA
ncbi:ABC transporter permease subunit [Modestobacter marinus]|uniref:ABC transporter n=1 Tax=Modestobacter marinus TaxID=477641 RepID=A0A846LK25_9ACTN|nr:ABC transporter permease [Modestobacter marinus]NIH65648.1 ABC-2 type transport system permease protein [Modestobacter marinus]GGL66055.1 ABC transporter [Modestobacter marinus]